MPHEHHETPFNIAFEDYEPFDPVVPEKNLLKAVLLTAIADLKKPGEPGRKATEFFLNKDEDYIFSFISICDHLSIDPQKILMVTGIGGAQIRPHLDERTPSSDASYRDQDQQ